MISMLPTRQHWIFDLDGTLTVAVHDFDAIRRELGIPDKADIIGHLTSLPPEESRYLLTQLQEIEHELALQTKAALGACELLEKLHSRGARTGILTRNTRENTLRTLNMAGLGAYFEEEHILGRNEVLPKPDPEGILHLAGKWGARPAELVMVGDYLYDLQAGRNAGTLTVHVSAERKFNWPDLTDIAIESLQELVRCLAQAPEDNSPALI